MNSPQLANVDVYTARFSPPCMTAKALLDRKGVIYSEYFVDRDVLSQAVMVKRSGGRTSVPQIFVNGRPIGGDEQLQALELCGELDQLLCQAPPRSRSSN